MPPDTTQTLVNTAFDLKNFLEHFDTILSIIGGGGLLGLLTKELWPLFKQWRDRLTLRHRPGAKLYSKDEIAHATRYYLRPQCQSIDPAQGPEIRGVYASREDLFSAVDRMLDEPAESKYLLLLADSGMGKTSFLLNYYARRLHRHQRSPLYVVPLGIKDADKRIHDIDNKSDTVLFLDALDEDTLAIVDHRQRLFDLCTLTREFRRVLMTCRTQFFPRAEEEPKRTGVVKLSSQKAGEPAEYIFHKLYLSPFDDKQVAKYLRRRYPLWHWLKRQRAQQVAAKIPQLTARPMLLAHIDDLLASGREFSYSFQLYEEMIEAWLTREIGKVESLNSKEPLREFCEQLAVELFVRRQAQRGERLPHANIEPLAQQFGLKLEGWKLSGRSLLNRDAEDNFKFAHRSVMEYLFVKRFLELPVAQRPDLTWTDQMKRFLLEIIRCHWETNRKVPFDLSKADLSELGRLQPKPLFKLRSSEKRLKEEDVRQMLNGIGFFDSRWNKDVYGILHLYEAFELESGKVVVDHATGLTWQQSGSSNYITHADAEKYIRDLNTKRFAGYADWRLPTLEDAMSLMEREKKNGDLYIDPVFDRTQRWIWTADKESAGRAWFVHFDDGYCGHYAVGSTVDDGSVRAVRS
ncbi:MAG: hypothetical protein ILNGONEN_01838 [Syntrophorhabdaceae bacterium]|nr:hypothetical protein [Syntrophorhabdaceae bacterium]